MHLVPACDGCMYAVDEEGEYWRVYEFIPDSVCLQRAEHPQDLYHVGLAFGNFQQLLADFRRLRSMNPFRIFTIPASVTHSFVTS